MQTLKTISHAQKSAASYLAARELRFLPEEVQNIFYNTDPLYFYAIEGEEDSGLLWACNGALEIQEFIPEDDFIAQVREAFDFSWEEEELE